MCKIISFIEIFDDDDEKKKCGLEEMLSVNYILKLSYEYFNIKYIDLSYKEGYKLFLKLLSSFFFDKVVFYFLIKKFFGVVIFIIFGSMKDKFGCFMLFYCVVILIFVVLMYDGNGMFILLGFGLILFYLKSYLFRMFILYFFIYSGVIFGFGMFGGFLL